MAFSQGMSSRSMGRGSLENEEQLIRSIKQLVIHCMPYLREAGSYDAAEEALVHMEENDENFHRHSSVKWLRGQIDSHLGNLIEDEIEKHSMSASDAVAGQETLVSQISSKILSSKDYQKLMQTLKSRVMGASDFLLKNFDEEFTAEGSDKSTLGRTQSKSEVLYSDGESSLGDSSLNHSTVMFMNNEQFHSIADSLDKKKSPEVRKETLKKLMSIATVDIQNCEDWPRIKQGMQEALEESDSELWTASLQLLARGLAVNNTCTKDIYVTIVEYLALQFRKSSIFKLKNGLDCCKPEHNKIIKSFRLINEFQRQVPQYWVRYPEKFLEDVIDATSSLLSIHPNTAIGTSLLISPVHFLALVDIRANWLTMWMHGHYSRAPLLKVLHKQRSIVDNAIRACLLYASSRRSSESSVPDSGSSLPSSRSSQRMFYSGQELEFAYFVHSLHMLGKLIFYEKGRSFFPVKVREREEPVTLTQLLVCLVQLLTKPLSALPSKALSMQCEPRKLVSSIIKQLCTSEVVCSKCVCHDELTNALLAPIVQFMKNGGDPGFLQSSETTLMQVADILSCIAATSCGRQHLLFGKTATSPPQSKFKPSKSTAAHVLAEFAVMTLSDRYNDITPESKVVIGHIVFVCRQLYSTCEGLLVMNPYKLHLSFSQAWQVASREVDLAHTPTPADDDAGSDNTPRQSQYIALWEDTLRDNLLNFASTPKGLLLLRQTSAINECIAYLDYRHTRKFQVSKCEKFGYGYMLSQVAATACGVAALQNTGFMGSLVKAVWVALEDDSPVYTPRVWPVSVIDKYARKPFARLVTMLSSFAAVNEIFGGKPLPAKDVYSYKEHPESIQDLFDRLVMVDTPSKICALFNYEQSHAFGLRLLAVMTSCLDTFLLLQTQYNIQAMLLRCQADNMLPDSKVIIIDMLSVERNYLLVKTYLMGGPNERVFPSREISAEKDKVLKYPLFANYPVPTDYHIKITNKPSKQDTDLSKFLSESKQAEMNLAWLDKCRKLFCSLLTTKPDAAKGPVLQDLLEKTIQIIGSIPEENAFPQMSFTASDASLKNVKLTQIQQLGIELTVRYGTTSKFVSFGPKEGRDKLGQLLKQSSSFLQHQRAPQPSSSDKSSPLYCLKQSSFPGFDWFAATIFLMMNGSSEKAWKFLFKFSTLLSSPYLWLHRLHASNLLPQSIMQSAIPLLFSKTCHYVELVLQADVPHVNSAFKMSGFSPAQICQHWLRQVFWNYLDWVDICHYVCVCIVLGIDYQVYICVAILRHLQKDLMRTSQSRDLITFLKEEPIRGFRVGEHLEFMCGLENKYRSIILKDMQELKKP